MPCTVLVGGFFGDEGKGKLISYIALKDDPKIIARGGVGPNAGHTVEHEGKKFFLRMVPSGFINTNSRLLIGPGVALTPDIFLKEVELTKTYGRIGIDRNCAIIEDKHINLEENSEHLSKKIGSTKSGVGACNADRALRKVKYAHEISDLSKYIVDVSQEINIALENEERVLLEGTQGTYLSLYHGTYPFCTSKDVCASAICSDVGVGPTKIDDVIVVFKAYVTRVGSGTLEGELPHQEAKKRGWIEYGTVTGRERRVAPFNFDLAKTAVILNGATQLAITKIDVVFPDCKGSENFEELSEEAKNFIHEVESKIKVPVTLIGTGPSALDIVDRR
ncbi:MAG: adenylosuccinate synthetase [Candidatus Bathyarchaeota archaeon]|nr:adenylosuccinate synthetase [Candidatus Bathyarchaeota archaeon]MCZ2845562.1 adenylosuccinate synthetase [Candidatus Bathyarchaeota archaeon]